MLALLFLEIRNVGDGRWPQLLLQMDPVRLINNSELVWHAVVIGSDRHGDQICHRSLMVDQVQMLGRQQMIRAITPYCRKEYSGPSDSRTATWIGVWTKSFGSSPRFKRVEKLRTFFSFWKLLFWRIKEEAKAYSFGPAVPTEIVAYTISEERQHDEMRRVEIKKQQPAADDSQWLDLMYCVMPLSYFCPTETGHEASF